MDYQKTTYNLYFNIIAGAEGFTAQKARGPLTIKDFCQEENICERTNKDMDLYVEGINILQYEKGSWDEKLFLDLCVSRGVSSTLL